MNTLEKLMAKLCPNGVEYKQLGDVATKLFRGSGVLRTQVTDTGVPCVRYGEIYTTYNIWFDETVSHTRLDFLRAPKFFENGDILFAMTGEKIEEIGKAVAYVGHEKCIAGGDIAVMRHNQDPKFLAYALSSADVQRQKSRGKVKSKVVHQNIPALMLVEIPIPPLPVQKEIVRMLDEMIGLIDTLEEEVAVRKQQYEWSRDKLLRIADGVEYKPLGDVLKYEQPTKYIVHSTEYDNSYATPVLTAGQSFILGYTDEEDNHYQASKESPVIIFDDFTTATQWVDFEFKVKSSAMKILSLKNSVMADIRFVYFAIQCIEYAPGEHTRQWIEKYSKFAIPIPPLAVQEEIVRMLDEMTGLIDELNEEIALRKQQYEYYRDKLLTFKKVR